MKIWKKKRWSICLLISIWYVTLQAKWETKVDDLKALTLEMLNLDGDMFEVELEASGEVRIAQKDKNWSVNIN